MRPLGPAAGSFVLLAGALAPAGLGTDSARPVEPALHRLLRDLVDEAHERAVRDGAESPQR